MSNTNVCEVLKYNGILFEIDSIVKIEYVCTDFKSNIYTNKITGRIHSFKEYDIFNIPQKINVDCSKEYWLNFYTIPISSIINIEKVN